MLTVNFALGVSFGLSGASPYLPQSPSDGFIPYTLPVQPPCILMAQGVPRLL
jgi:hypothetical protein